MTAAVSTAPALRLSVVVTVTSGGRHVDACLRALAAQRDAPPFEVLVPVDASVPGVKAWQRAHPEVEFPYLEGPAARAGDPGAAHLRYDRRRAAGLARARAPVVALTEDHARPDPDWCARIVAAHERLPHAAIGGAIENASDHILNWAVYFCDFGRYQNPLPAGPAAYVSDVNVSYKQHALAQVDHVWRGAYHETAVHGALVERGESLWLLPEIVVRQARDPLQLRTCLRERVAWGRLYAGKRVREMSPLRRWTLALAAPLLPAVLFARRARESFARGRHRGAFLRAAPAVVGLLGAWAYGEWLGYVTGEPTRPAR